MVRYRRNIVPGGTFFFTVTLRDRRSSHLTNYISNLRNAFRVARQERPFAIDAIVILPDHLHAVLTLPEEDTDFSGRWRRIKSHFARHVAAAEPFIKRNTRGEHDLWQSRFWEHTIRDTTILRGMSITSNTTRSSTDSSRGLETGPIRRSTLTFVTELCRPIGGAVSQAKDRRSENRVK